VEAQKTPRAIVERGENSCNGGEMGSFIVYEEKVDFKECGGGGKVAETGKVP